MGWPMPLSTTAPRRSQKPASWRCAPTQVDVERVLIAYGVHPHYRKVAATAHGNQAGARGGALVLQKGARS